MRVRPTLAAALVAIAWFAIGGAAGVASAHAEFQQGSVTAGSTTQLTLDVPDERAAPRYTSIVRIQVPVGWTAVGCARPAGWTCETNSGEIDFQYDGGPPQESFSFTVTAPSTPTTTTFPVVQIYDNGENVLWSNTAVVSVVPAPTPPPPTTPPTTTGPSTPTTGSGTNGGAANASTTSTTAGATVRTTEQSAVVATRDLAADDDRSATSGEGSSALPLVLGGLAVVVLAGGGIAWFVVRRRT